MIKKKTLVLLLILSQLNALAFDHTARAEYDEVYANEESYEYEMTTYADEPAAPIDSWTPFLLIAGVLYSVYYFEKKRKTSNVSN